jgi:solute:Na+ symporter, SSS family
MNEANSFSLNALDLAAFVGYLVILCLIGFWAGRKKKKESADYFLAGRSLPWYVVGGSFIASNISTEHFIGMIGAAFVYGICVAMSEWGNILSFTFLIWLFIPFLLSARVFTTPEFMERRFNPVMRQFFAGVTIISNVVAFLAAVLYGGGLAIQKLFGWNLWLSVIVLGLLAGSWVVYGGLVSVAWTDLFTVAVMVVGGSLVTVFGLRMLAGDSGSLVEGFKIMVERNQAQSGLWQEVVAQNARHIVGFDEYHRLSVIQPLTHQTTPWIGVLIGFLSVSIWYNVINQFMIQRVLGARNAWHARMGIVFAGYMKIILPLIVVVPGLILFAAHPEVMKLPWDDIRPEADKGYVLMLQTLLPTGIRGVFLAALFGAIQSTVNAVLNSTSTVFTMDIYKRLLRKQASERDLVRVGRLATVVILLIAMVMAMFIERLGGSLFVYIQTLYAFFAPPFAAVFLLGILFKRINGKGATTAVFLGFALGIAMKVYIQLSPSHPLWLEPYANQAIINWFVCAAVCVAVSLLTAPPAPEQVTDELTINWRKLNIFDELGSGWSSVTLWWAIFAVIILALVILLW